MIQEITYFDRKVQCNGQKCPQYASYVIVGRNKHMNFCRACILKVVAELCEYGFVRRESAKHIEEKGL